MPGAMKRTLATLILLAGCDCGGGAGGPDAARLGDGRAELGTGTVAWLPLAPEQELEVIAGPQGGHHFIVHARIGDLLPGDPTMPGQLGNPITRFAAFVDRGGGEQQIDLMFPPYRLGYGATGDGWYALASGRILQLDEDHVPGLVGQRVRLTVEVTDARGELARDERFVTAIEGAPLDGADAGPGDAGPHDAGLADAGP